MPLNTYNGTVLKKNICLVQNFHLTPKGINQM